MKKRKFDVDDNYFLNIDNEYKAYWLGFIYTDGNVSKKYNTISIGVSKIDKEHLKKFCKEIKYNGNIVDIIYNKGFSNKSNMSILSISSKNIKNDLKLYNIIPNKSNVISPPKNLNKNLYRHFWRGALDGDGSIFFSENKNKKWKSWGVSLCGTKETVCGFSKFLSEELGIANKKPKLIKNSNTYSVRYMGTNIVLSIVNLLYLNSNIYLDRKYNKYCDVKKYNENKQNKKTNNMKKRKDKHRIKNIYFRRIRRALFDKNNKNIKELGYCSIDLQNHISSLFQEGMNWDNYGINGWSIAFKKPLSSYNLEDGGEILEAFHYSNMFPIFRKDNINRSIKIRHKNYS